MPLIAEMGWGGLVQYPSTITWTDFSQYVDMVQGVTITRGASDERSETQPGSVTLRLDNQDGRFTPGNSLSPYYPYVRRNAPIRISVAVIPSKSGSAPYPMAMLGDDFDDNRVNASLWTSNYGGPSEVGGRMRVPVSTAGNAAFLSAREWSLVGSKLTARLVTLPGTNGSSAAVASMFANSTTSGTRLGWRYNALTNVLSAENQTGFSDGSAVALTYSAIDHKWVRVRESGGTVYWETSGDGWGWTVRRSVATPAWVTSQTLAVEFPTLRTGGTNDFVEWDLVGAEVRPRFYGMVNEFPVVFEGLSSKVTISATDLFKRLNRLPPLRSMLAQEILSQDIDGVTDGVGCYYPLTEPSGSASAGDISGGGCGALALAQAGTGGTVDFGGEGLAETGDTSVVFTPASSSQGKYLAGDLGPGFQANSGPYAVNIEFWVKTTTTSRAILGLYEPSLDHQVAFVINGTGQLTVEHTESGGTLNSYNTGEVVNDGAWHHVVFDGTLSAQVYVDGALAATSVTIPYISGLRTLHIGGYRGARMFDGQIAHVAITFADGRAGDDISAVHYEAATTGFSGEAADERIERLTRYAGLSSVTILGSTHDAIASQGPAGSSVVARMREVESTESARLYAERDWYGLAYQSRDVRYNPDPANETFTIDYADLETGGVSLPDDDQKMVNSLEASRPGGATQRVTAPASIFAFGLYEPSPLSILKTNDNSVLDAAYWLVSRYANPSPELREVPIEAFTMSTYLDILDADISSYFSVFNLPSQAPASTLRVTVEGYTETIKEQSHRIQFHTSASVTDSVWVLDDSTYSVLGSTTRLAY